MIRCHTAKPLLWKGKPIMSISSMIKLKSSSERDAAIALDRAVKAVFQNNIEVMKDVISGVERTSWYSACLFDQYENECAELKSEDIRFITAVLEIYKRKDVVSDIIRLLINEELKNMDGSSIQKIDRLLTGLLSGYFSGRLTKTSMAYALSTLIVSSFNFKNEIIVQLNKYSLAVVTAASLYGKVHMAASEARKLKSLSPSLYFALYQNNIEMLYFLVSEKVNKALINSMGLRGEDRFISIIKTLTY